MPNPGFLQRRHVVLGAPMLGLLGSPAFGQAPVVDDPWPALANQIFDGRTVEDGGAFLAIEAPYRAEDAAIVPISIRIAEPEDDTRRVDQITLVIDENPSPLAAVFTPGEKSGIRMLSTRVRIDSYTNVHVVAAIKNAGLLGTKRFVKAAGGCSAPAAKQDSDTIPLGTMRFRQFAAAAGSDRQEAQLMIRHPNYTGMQMNQLTRLYVPAHFIESVQIWQGDDPLLKIESGISIAENPEFRFDYRPNGAAEFRAEVKDSEAKVFKASWPVTRA